MVRNQIFKNGLCIILLILCGKTAQAQERRFNLLHAGIHGGMGLPKVSFALYRPPVAVTGGAFALLRPHRKWALQLSANALHTFSLGTSANVDRDLKFNTQWISADALIHLQGLWMKENFIVIGLGRYKHHQVIDNSEHEKTTSGLSLGLLNWQRRKKWTTRMAITWHLLFEPSERPQVLTITLGMML